MPSSGQRKALMMAVVLLATPVIAVRAQVGLISAGVRLATAGAIGAASGVVEIGKGQYQLPDQTWHSGKLLLEGLDRLQVQEQGRKNRTILKASEVQALAAGTDTFRVVRNFADPKKPEKQVEACFMKQVYKGGGYLLTSYKWGSISSPEWNGDGLMLSHGTEVVAIPTKRQEFEQLMLTLFGDHPGLARQLKAGDLRANQTKQIVALYVNWKQQPAK